MDDSGHRENGRHKADQYRGVQGQWLMHPPSMKQIMTIMAERDAAIQERNIAISEKKAAIAERDMAFLQRDAAIAERNSAVLERDNAIANLQYRENSFSSGNTPSYPSGSHVSHGVKHMQHPQQSLHHQTNVNEACNAREVQRGDAPLMSAIGGQPDVAKPKRGRRPKDAQTVELNKKATKPSKKVKMESEDLNRMMFDIPPEWKNVNDRSPSGEKQSVASKPDWKGQDLGLNQVVFDDSTMPPPVCSCTGVLRQCYKWGNGGWQSACCTTTISMYPLPAVPNKKHARIGGRKMSGSAFIKLLNRLATEGHDFSNPIDLKDHWARHGTNRYITIK